MSDIESLKERLDEERAWLGNHEDGDCDPLQEAQQLFSDALAAITALQSKLAEAERAFRLADRLACEAMDGGFYVGEGILKKLSDARATIREEEPLPKQGE